jgi:hypothetical protein
LGLADIYPVIAVPVELRSRRLLRFAGFWTASDVTDGLQIGKYMESE